MKKLFTFIFLSYSFFAFSQEKTSGWKAGVASVIITPPESMWMGGFAFRDRPSEGVTIDLWAKALALQAKDGKRAVLISLETSGIGKIIYDTILKRLTAKYNLSKEEVIISNSHTHTGASTSFSFTRDPVQRQKIEDHIKRLEAQVVEIVGRALQSMEPVNLFAENGVTRFQVNRRNNIEPKLPLQSKFNGPNDYAVPVLKVTKESGELLAVAFGYACHSSILRDYKFSGDYPGFAQIELEKIYPGATALFFQGTGGNQIGWPRSSVEAAKQYGRTLAAAVERVLSEKMRELPSALVTSYTELDLESAKLPPGREELIKMIGDTVTYPANVRRGAQTNLDRINRGEPVLTTYPYPVQVWKIGDQPLITLGGEPIVEYALELKQIFGQNTFVFGYSNYVMAYISTPLVLNEGGYEGSSTPFFNSKWAQNTETMIIQGVLKLAKQVNVGMIAP